MLRASLSLEAKHRTVRQAISAPVLLNDLFHNFIAVYGFHVNLLTGYNRFGVKRNDVPTACQLTECVRQDCNEKSAI